MSWLLSLTNKPPLLVSEFPSALEITTCNLSSSNLIVLEEWASTHAYILGSTLILTKSVFSFSIDRLI
jgi:hypothetical protein